MTTSHRGLSAYDETGGLGTPRAALLRAAADDELGGREADALRRILDEYPNDAARIEFERDLRSACRRVMSSDDMAPPAGLRDRVVAMVGASVMDHDAAEHRRTVHNAKARSNPEPRRRRVRTWWLAGAVVAIAIFALGIRVANLLRPPTFAESPERARLVLAGFLGSEHRRCALDDRTIKRKMTEYRLSEAPATYKNLLGAELSVADVEKAGYTFLGAGRCIVPGSGASVHLIFGDVTAAPGSVDKSPTCDPTRLSLFIQEDTGELPISPGTTYRLDLGESSPLVVVWTRGGLVYYLVTETKAAEESVLDHLGMATVTSPL